MPSAKRRTEPVSNPNPNVSCGVYEILHTPSRRRYVGGSIEIEKRLYLHVCLLKLNQHHCKKLQELWNSSQPSDFEFYILERCKNDRELVKDREQVHLDRTSDERLLNTSRCSRSNAGLEISEETRAKMSAQARVFGALPHERKSRSERAKRQHAEKKLGKWAWKTDRKQAKPRQCRTCKEMFVPERVKEGYYTGSKFCVSCRPVHHGGRYHDKEAHLKALAAARNGQPSPGG